MRNPFRKRENHYPAIKALTNEASRRWVEAGRKDDQAGMEAAEAERMALQDWIIYATCGKDRHDPKIIESAKRSAKKAAEFSRLSTPW